ncbi:MAG: hypothetical protein HC784_14510, partial [Hydrococcus sp. CSU_1_8]|nr:hypothetical protein [Hydrococcus sp. CSU_1_8]
LPIASKTLSRTGRDLSGVELLKGDDVKRLGLEAQAKLEIRPQVTAGLPTSQQLPRRNLRY